MEGVNSGGQKKGIKTKRKERKGKEAPPLKKKNQRERVEFNIVSIYTLEKYHAP